MRLHPYIWVELTKYHTENKKQYSKDIDIILSDTVDMLLEEILEQKDDKKINIQVDLSYRELLECVDIIVSEKILGYYTQEEFIISAIRRHIEDIIRYDKTILAKLKIF